jgi:hypothetical protein
MVALLSLSLITAGCTVAQIESYINLAAQVALNVLQITSAFSATPLSAHDAAIVNECAAVMQASVASFEANKTAGNSTLASVAGAAETNLTAWMAAIQVDNPQLLARLQAAVTSFLTIVESIAAIVGPGVVPPAPAAATMRMGGVFRLPPRVKVARSAIVKTWNNTVCMGASAACMVK